MKYTLRPYQQEAVDAAIAHMKKSIMPAVLELATGAGKSLIVAALAKWIHDTSGKKVLCIQPSAELTKQNFDKYASTGEPASIFSASAGGKCMRHPVVYGTPGTLKNALSRLGDKFGAVILDEAHTNTPSIRLIIESMREKNPNLRVIGMTATPYRSTTGYIYQYDASGVFVPEDQAIAPYFNNLLYSIQTQELIAMGFLTPAHADPDIAASYDSSGMMLNNRGQFDSKEVERVFEGQGRLTSQIVADVVRHSIGRDGVMIFAATVQHAKEALASLTPDNSRMVGGDVNMGKSDREKLISDFKAKRFKYLVSVGTLTTGFDAPHVSVVAILRATESPGLLQQIIGRGLRLCDGKDDCLVLDYAENIDRHGLHDDLFTPEIKVRTSSSNAQIVQCKCLECGYGNEFAARPNPDRFDIDANGYFRDLAGELIETGSGFMPAHLGRRCQGQVEDMLKKGLYARCTYLWTCKKCPECDHDNDITARFCSSCKIELIDPNEKLREDFHRVKKDPYSISTDKVTQWSARKGVSQSGKETVICEYTTEYRTFKIWYTPDSKHPDAVSAWKSLNDAVYSGHIAPDADTFIQYLNKGKQPETITCFRQKGSSFFRVLAHNQPEDQEPLL